MQYRLSTSLWCWESRGGIVCIVCSREKVLRNFLVAVKRAR
jgi:hypothetical protein